MPSRSRWQDAHTVESTRAEVAAAVETVMRASATVPRRSLAVVAGNDLHAARIADALRERDEAVAARVPVVVCGEAAGLSADEVVLSVGYARDHRGVLPADMGILTSRSRRRPPWRRRWLPPARA